MVTTMHKVEPKPFLVNSFLYHAPTGVDDISPPPAEQTIRLGGEINFWTVKRNDVSPKVQLFALQPDYPWSGVDNNDNPDKVVALACPGPRAVSWYVTPAEGARKGAYTIAWDRDHNLLWTVAEPFNQNSQIVLRPKEIGNPRQWFKIIHPYWST